MSNNPYITSLPTGWPIRYKEQRNEPPRNQNGNDQNQEIGDFSH